MHYTVSIDPAQQTVILSGRITFSDHGSFKQLIGQLQEGRGKTALIDLSGVEYVDSAAIGMFLLLRDQLGGDTARVILAHPHGLVRKVLLLSNFNKLFEMRD